MEVQSGLPLSICSQIQKCFNLIRKGGLTFFKWFWNSEILWKTSFVKHNLFPPFMSHFFLFLRPDWNKGDPRGDPVDRYRTMMDHTWPSMSMANQTSYTEPHDFTWFHSDIKIRIHQKKQLILTTSKSLTFLGNYLGYIGLSQEISMFLQLFHSIFVYLNQS